MFKKILSVIKLEHLSLKASSSHNNKLQEPSPSSEADSHFVSQETPCLAVFRRTHQQSLCQASR
jgi:hypothetical protein